MFTGMKTFDEWYIYGGGYCPPSIIESSLCLRRQVLATSLTNAGNPVEGFYENEDDVIEE